jgi:hypothetical protein
MVHQLHHPLLKRSRSQAFSVASTVSKAEVLAVEDNTICFVHITIAKKSLQ